MAGAPAENQLENQPGKKVAVVTGTSRGIGRHLAGHLLEAGYFVEGCSRKNDGALQHRNYRHHIVDVAREAEVVEMFRAVREKHGSLDVAVNNAAINPALSLTALTPFSAAEETMAVNFLGTFVVCREAVKLMMRKKFGRIINLGSMAARHEVAGEAAYTASKAAVNAFTRVLAKEVSALGITCNVVAPAAIETELMAKINPEALKDVLKRNAIPSFGNLSDVSSVVDWLLRPESGAVTGQLIYLGGV